MKRIMNSDFGAWSVFSVAGLAASLTVAGLVPRLVHASAHEMFEAEAAQKPEAASHSGEEKGGWDTANNPGTWSPTYEYRFDQLPLSGQMEDHTPWSDTYWPSNHAGIAARWNQSGSNGFRYGLFNETQVRALSPEAMARLSPAEKYDILMGRFDYPTVAQVRGNTSPHAASWEGICHGWSPAALNHAEPMPVTVTSDSGISVPFGSADVKGLLDQYYATNARATEFLGLRCQRGGGGFGAFIGFFRGIANPTACQDVNAGALHIILTNQLGIRHQGFVADVDKRRQVWNQPVFGFNSRIVGERRPSRDAAPGTVREVLVHTEMMYTDEIAPSWDPVVGTPNFSFDKGVYDYSLELDASGRIIGGEYYLASNRAHPDFLWNAPRLQFSGYYQGINRIYRASPHATQILN